jgi:hypothetical protein
MVDAQWFRSSRFKVSRVTENRNPCFFYDHGYYNNVSRNKYKKEPRWLFENEIFLRESGDLT